MKFKVKYTKLGNHFFFISNLTEWHFSCKKKYNQEWLKKTGPLIPEEKKALMKFARILKKYGFKKKKNKNLYLGIPFISSSQKTGWQRVKNWVNKKEYLEIKNIFEIFQKRFNKIWEEDKEKLRETAPVFEAKLNSKRNRSLLQTLANLYQTNLPLNKRVNIYLLSGPRNASPTGMAEFGGRGISITITDPKYLTQSLLIILHETVHFLFEKDFRKKIRKLLPYLKIHPHPLIKTYSKTTIVSELILDTFLPSGYLAQIYYKIDVLKRNRENLIFFKQKRGALKFYALRNFVVLDLYKLTKNYVESKKPLDEFYIRSAVKAINKFFKKVYK